MDYSLGKCLLKQHLKRVGLTQVQLADRLGMSKSMIGHFANNRKVMSYEIAFIISKIVKCKMEELYEWHRQE